ncbi:3503_t:CDS:2, partial [Gigaspora margarita]
MKKNSNNTPEDCSEEKNLQVQLDDNDSIEIVLDEKKIVKSIQNISFEEAVVMNKDNLERNLKLSQQVKLISKTELAIWKYVNKETLQLLKQFDDATIEILSQTYPTIAHAQIILLALRSDLEPNKDDEVQKYWLFAEANKSIKLLD